MAAAVAAARGNAADVLFGAVNCAVLAELCVEESVVEAGEGPGAYTRSRQGST